MKVGLDIDGVLANFGKGVIKRAQQLGFGDKFPKCHREITTWNICPEFYTVMRGAWMDPKFWLGLEVLECGIGIPFEVDCYITARPIDSRVTKKWLDENYFPDAPVLTVATHANKLLVAQRRDLTVFVDDLHTTVRAMRENGLDAVLMDAPYNRDVTDLPRIKYLGDL